MHRRWLSTTSKRLSYHAKQKKLHWADESRLLNSVQRALTHYDDFYASMFGQQWPSLRLGLLSPPKYMAIPNSLTGNTQRISEKLQELGAYNIQEMWVDYRSMLERENEIDLKSDLGRLHQLDKKLESIAATKRAEELDVLYQNAPTSKREEMRLGKGPLGRVVSDVSEAAASFVPSTKLKGADDFTFDSEYFSSYLRQHEPLTLDDIHGEREFPERDESLRDVQFLKSSNLPMIFPKFLIPFSFENGSSLMFPGAKRDAGTGYRDYICVNGASILPVLALNLRPDCKLLDMCAGPGTKSILSLMSMCVGSLTCNDLESSRLNRVKRIMHEFTGSREPTSVYYTKMNARDYPVSKEFTRVLADVPCLNDRVATTIVDNNIFKPKRTKERLNLVRTQKDILMSGFKALSPEDGSTIVYSTCTLSPIENDGVVVNALKDTEVNNLHVDLMGLVKLVRPLEAAGIFKIMRTRCGILVLPNTVNNFGPMYVSRIVVKRPTSSTIPEGGGEAKSAE